MPHGSNNPLPSDANALRDAARSSYHRTLEDGRRRFTATSQGNNHRSPGTHISPNAIAPLSNRMGNKSSPPKVKNTSPLRESTTTTLPTAKEDHVPNLANAARVTVPPAVAPVKRPIHSLPAKPTIMTTTIGNVSQRQSVTRPNGIDNATRAPVIPPSAPAAYRSPASKAPGRSTSQIEVPGKNAGAAPSQSQPRHGRVRVGNGPRKTGDAKTGITPEGNLSTTSNKNVNGKRPITHVEAPVDAAAKRRRLSDTTTPTQQAERMPFSLESGDNIFSPSSRQGTTNQGRVDQSSTIAPRHRQFSHGENEITNPAQTAVSKSSPAQSAPIKIPAKSIQPTLTPTTTRFSKPLISVKRESSSPPPRQPTPIDIDAPPKSLYQELGFPERTSGVYRVPYPVFKNERPVKDMKHEWTKEMTEKIRWVRGKGITPLVVGKVFWRSDGVTFDWEISSEEMKERERDAVGVEKSTGRVPTTAPDTQVNPSIATTTATTSPTTENQSGPESSSNHRSSNLSSSSTQTTSTAPRPVVCSTAREGDTNQAFVDTILQDVVIKQEEVESTIPPTPAPSHEGLPAISHSNVSASNSSASLALSPQSVVASPNSLSNIAVCFLDRYTRCFDDIKCRNKLSEAYANDAIMSLQFNDLPTEGTCPRVGNPKKQGHCIVNFAERDDGRNLLLESDRMFRGTQFNHNHKLVIGRDRITARLASFEALTHFTSMVSPREYKFNVTPLGEYGCLLLVHEGDLFARKAADGDAYVSLRFHHSFILRPNVVDSPSWIDWPWIVTNDQMTLFHRPGIVCQCPP